ncbi:hypothetical protein Plo01_35440 [Planobispora longispora]|uniref:Uncharacterized protein n=1 Tax=Planobispora longispora TaxID=28887 RepID=A0A8J3RLG3_9ACTN|nr:hypothetical protein GCM10020093_029460 [Planobispora longispora]GIH77115.1 hypothetical protein Plo01_35440 [Planobispora longispora]
MWFPPSGCKPLKGHVSALEEAVEDASATMATEVIVTAFEMTLGNLMGCSRQVTPVELVESAGS